LRKRFPAKRGKSLSALVDAWKHRKKNKALVFKETEEAGNKARLVNGLKWSAARLYGRFGGAGC